jgi:hypothetical protein
MLGLLTFAVLSTPLPASEPGDERFYPDPGLEPTHHGACVRLVGDCDLDGSDDVIVGTYWGKKGKGRAVVFSGKTGKELHSVQARETGTLFGLVVGSTGDADNDGTADFVVSAPLEERRGKRVGVVRVYSGRDGKLLHEFVGRDDGERFGFAVNVAGDIDVDGFGDLIVGAPGARANKKSAPGAVRVYSGKTGEQLYEWFGDEDGDEFGASVDSAGDCDGDGKPELLAASRTGYARVFQGRKGKVLYELEPEDGDARFGWCVRGVGDVNQDASGDLIVGIPWGETIGARVYSGKKKNPVLHVLERDVRSGSEGWSFGVVVDGAGDLNADGFDEFLVTDPGFPGLLSDVTGTSLPPLLARVRDKVARPGRVYVYDGHKAELLYTLKGSERDDWFGVSAGRAGDVDQDGFGDFVVGSGPDSKVHARIYSGQDGSVLHELSVD